MKAVVAVVIGNLLEFYDFLVFTFFAVMIADAFFPGESQITRLLGALATFGVGFVTRPLGAAVIGAYADRKGRRAALTLTLLLMAFGSTVVAVTPTYAQIGLAAPIILLVARLIQGFSCGGEVGPATTYLLESVPIDKRAAVTAWQGYSQQIAIFLGSLAGVILTSTSSPKRCMHGAGACHSCSAWSLRPSRCTSAASCRKRSSLRRSGPPATSWAHCCVITGERSSIGILIICGGTVSTYVFNYMTTYAITTLHLSATIGTTLTLAGSVANMAGIYIGVSVDRFGRKRMLILQRAIFVSIVYPAYLLMTSPDASPWLVVAMNMLLNCVFATTLGAVYAFLPEAFPKSVRSSGLAILYALGVTIFGGTTQFVVAWLIDWTKNPMVPAWYQIAASLAGIAGSRCSGRTKRSCKNARVINFELPTPNSHTYRRRRYETPRPRARGGSLHRSGGTGTDDRSQVMAPITKFMETFNKGDVAGAASTHAAGGDVVIVDEVPPFVWRGPGAFQGWAGDLARVRQRERHLR